MSRVRFDGYTGYKNTMRVTGDENTSGGVDVWSANGFGGNCGRAPVR